MYSITRNIQYIWMLRHLFPRCSFSYTYIQLARSAYEDRSAARDTTCRIRVVCSVRRSICAVIPCTSNSASSIALKISSIVSRRPLQRPSRSNIPKHASITCDEFGSVTFATEPNNVSTSAKSLEFRSHTAVLTSTVSRAREFFFFRSCVVVACRCAISFVCHRCAQVGILYK